MTGIATHVRTVADRPDRRMAVYHVEPPIRWKQWDGEADVERTSDHVCVSGVVASETGPETLVFACDDPAATPPIADFCELYPGSFRGAIDHVRALAYAGYEIASTHRGLTR